jgi:hypothetical protein
MDEPEFNNYLITVEVTDISKANAVKLAELLAELARKSPGKKVSRQKHDVTVTVAHVKGLDCG